MQAKIDSQTLADFPTAHSVASRDNASNNNALGIAQELLRSIPNWVVLAIVAIGFVAEMIGLFQVQQPLVESGWRAALFTPIFICWFWLTVGLGLHKLAIKLRRIGRSESPLRWWLWYAACFVGFAVMIGMYATSWGLFLRTSRFANFEVLRFSFENFGELAKYVTAAEPAHLVYGVALLVAGWIGLWLLLEPLSQVRYPPAECPIFLNRLWFLMVTLTLAALALVQHNSNLSLAERNQIAFTYGLNPVVSLVGSAVESLRLDPIEQVIENPETELTPLSSGWKPDLASGVTSEDLPSIIMIQVESLRSDVIHAQHQGREVMPHLNRLAEKSLVWKNAYAQSTHSDYADPCIVSSLYPLRTRTHHYYGLDDPWPKQLSYDCLKQVGYDTATISSQNEMWGRMEHFLDSPNLDFFYHPERSNNSKFAEVSPQDIGFYRHVKTGGLKAGKFSDRHTADVAIDWIRERLGSGRPFLLNMNLQSSHFPYIIPDEAARPFQPHGIPGDASFAWYAPSQTEVVRNTYFNALSEVDGQLGRLFAALEESGRMKNTIIVVLGENGESFHENNQVCHANKPYNASTHIAAVMFGPRWIRAGEEEYPLEHVDILPTLFRQIGLEPHPNFQGIDALAADRPELKDRFLYFHTLSPLSWTDGLQWAGRWKCLWDFTRNQAELYDLATDPGETENLAEVHPQLASALGQQLERWRSRQLAWYHYPRLYQNYFPPSAPTVDPTTKAFLDDFLVQRPSASQPSQQQDPEND